MFLFVYAFFYSVLRLFFISVYTCFFICAALVAYSMNYTPLALSLVTE